MRRHLSCYFKGLPDFKETRIRLVTAGSPQEVMDILDFITVKWGDFSLEDSTGVYGL